MNAYAQSGNVPIKRMCVREVPRAGVLMLGRRLMAWRQLPILVLQAKDLLKMVKALKVSAIDWKNALTLYHHEGPAQAIRTPVISFMLLPARWFRYHFVGTTLKERGASSSYFCNVVNPTASGFRNTTNSQTIMNTNHIEWPSECWITRGPFPHNHILSRTYIQMNLHTMGISSNSPNHGSEIFFEQLWTIAQYHYRKASNTAWQHHRISYMMQHSGSRRESNRPVEQKKSGKPCTDLTARNLGAIFCNSKRIHKRFKGKSSCE